MRIVAGLSLLLLAACGGDARESQESIDTAAPGQGAVTPAPATPAGAALEAIRARGARPVLDSLYERDAGALDTWFAGIASGDSTWLEVARALLPQAEGEAAASITEAVANGALLRQPRLVLRLVEGTSSGDDLALCTPRLVEDPAQDLARLEADAKQALMTVEDPELRAVRDACIAAIDVN